ncbi:MAG: GTP-binding protein [Candidatus Altiarchaeota archaeon]
MPTLEEKIKEIEEEIKRTPYNKASQHHIGKLKAKLAKLREALEKGSEKGKISHGFSVKKEGDATVVLVGLPSVGKSTLLNKLTNAESRVASFDFTTIGVIPGIMHYNGAKIQILDIPGLISGASKGRGMGKKILSVARISDLILILVDALQAEKQLSVIEKELYGAGIRINKRKPDITIKRTSHGGITISKIKNSNLSDEEIKGVLNENGIFNADVVIREKVSIDDFIDVVIGNRVYLPAIVAVNKIDLLNDKTDEFSKKGFIPISSLQGKNLEKLKEEIFLKLEFIRVYMKPPGKKADMEHPLIMKKGSTVADICDRLHKEIKNKFRYASIIGTSVKFKNEKVGLKHILNDGDIVTIFTHL